MLATLSGGFSSILLQLSFPAALQLISIFIPLLYLLKQDPRLRDNIFSRGRVIFPLALAVAVSLALYVGSVVLLLAQNATLDREVPLAASSVPVIDVVVLMILACFLAIPTYFILDMWADLRGYRIRLPKVPEQEWSALLSRLANDREIRDAFADQYHTWRAQVKELEAGLKHVADGYRSFLFFCDEHELGLRSVAAKAIERNPQDPASDLAHVLSKGEHRRTSSECAEKIYGTRYGSDKQSKHSIHEKVGRSLAALALIQLKYDLDQIVGNGMTATSTTQASVGEE